MPNENEHQDNILKNMLPISSAVSSRAKNIWVPEGEFLFTKKN